MLENNMIGFSYGFKIISSHCWHLNYAVLSNLNIHCHLTVNAAVTTWVGSPPSLQHGWRGWWLSMAWCSWTGAACGDPSVLVLNALLCFIYNAVILNYCMLIIFSDILNGLLHLIYNAITMNSSYIIILFQLSDIQ